MNCLPELPWSCRFPGSVPRRGLTMPPHVPARWRTPACLGAGSSLLTSGPWQTELIVPLSFHLALTVCFFQAEARRGRAAIWETFSKGCLASSRGLKSMRVPGGGGPHTPEVFPVTSPGLEHGKPGHLLSPCPLLPRPMFSCCLWQTLSWLPGTLSGSHLAASFTFFRSLLKCHHFSEASPDHPI